MVRRRSLYVLVGVLWAVNFADPAVAPTTASTQVSSYQDFAVAMASRTEDIRAVASRAQSPAPPPDPDIVWPVRGQLTGWFGERRGPVRHPGLDIDGATGDPVVAAAAGRVLTAGPGPVGYDGYGLVVMIDHGDGLVSISAHLSKVLVHAGQQVHPGDRIGLIGTTGSTTGSHLHFELRRRGVQVDPKPWLTGAPPEK